MSVAVAVVSAAGAGLATDSLRVDLATGRASTGFVKHVAAGRRIAAFTGVCDWNGKPVSAWLATALDQARSLDEVPGEFLRVAGQDLVTAYHQWIDFTGGQSRPEDFLSILAVSTEAGHGEALDVWTRTESGLLTFAGTTIEPSAGTTVLASGTVDGALYGRTPQGRTDRIAAVCQRVSTDIAKQEQIDAEWDSVTCADHAASLVRAAILRQAGIARPAWWPAAMPVLARPVHQAAAP